MRVISGSRRGKKLLSPRGLNTRPTEDRVKESIFNILYKIEEDSLVLDCFAGTGAMGIEFLSRGASHCYFVDNSSESIDVIRENLKATKFIESATVIKGSILNFLSEANVKDIKFDYIYIDPPYEEIQLIYESINNISAYDLLLESGIIIVEHLSSLEMDQMVGRYMKYKSKKYGKKVISFYRVNLLEE